MDLFWKQFININKCHRLTISEEQFWEWRLSRVSPLSGPLRHSEESAGGTAQCSDRPRRNQRTNQKHNHTCQHIL